MFVVPLFGIRIHNPLSPRCYCIWELLTSLHNYLLELYIPREDSFMKESLLHSPIYLAISLSLAWALSLSRSLENTYLSFSDAWGDRESSAGERIFVGKAHATFHGCASEREKQRQ